MEKIKVRVDLRMANLNVAIFDIHGEINAFAENALMNAYTEASSKGASAIILNFKDLEFMNSSGIGLLVTLLIRVQRQKQKLLAFGLGEHYQQIFELTRLNDAIAIYPDESAALAAASN